MSYEPGNAPEPQDPGSTESNSPNDDLGSVIQAAANQSSQPTGEVEKLQKMVEDLRSTIGRQGSELGELRKVAATAAPPDTSDDDELSELVYSDPAQFAKRVASRIEAEVQQRLAPVVAPIEQANVLHTVQDGNPLAERLLNDPATNDYLTELSQDPNSMATFSDVKRLRLEAALFRRMGKLYGPQQMTRENPPVPPRPEKAGAADPGGTAASRVGVPDPKAPETLEDSVKAFTEGMQRAGH